MHGILFSRKLCGPWKCIERAECLVDRMINWSIIITHFSRTPTSWQSERTRYRTFNYVLFSRRERSGEKESRIPFLQKKETQEKRRSKEEEEEEAKKGISFRETSERSWSRSRARFIIIIIIVGNSFFFSSKGNGTHDRVAVSIISASGAEDMAGEKRGTKRGRKKKKSRAPSGVVAGCPRASFRDAPHGGGLWGHDGGAVPGPCNLKSSQGGSRGWGGGNNPGTPHGRSASPPYSSATMQQTHEKFTLQSAAKKSNVLREACALLPTMEPAIASLLTGETICADC